MDKRYIILLFSLWIPLAPHPTQASEQAQGSPVFPLGEWHSTVTLASDYIFRGISQTDRRPTIQGSIDYTHPSGFNLGLWGSNVDFNDGGEASTELDLYAGYSHTQGPWTGSVTATYYLYPSAAEELHYDYGSVTAELNYDAGIASLTALVDYTPENQGKSGNAYYYNMAANVPLWRGFSLDGHVGRQETENEAAFLPDYTDWGIGFAYEAGQQLTLRLDYVDTTLNEEQCEAVCDAAVVASVARMF